MGSNATLETIREIPDHLWEQSHPIIILELDPPKATGRKRADPKLALNGIHHLLAA